MKKKLWLFTLLFVLAVAFSGLSVYAAEDASSDSTSKTSNQASYSTSISGETVYLCNETALSKNVGTKATLEYRVVANGGGYKQAGFLTTDVYNTMYPFTGTGGYMMHVNADETHFITWLNQGSTYKVEYEVESATSFAYTVTETLANGTTSTLDLSEAVKYPEAGSVGGYFGLWFSAGVGPVRLTDMRFYDEEGNDLGFTSNKGDALLIKNTSELPEYKDGDLAYDITILGTSETWTACQTFYFSNETKFDAAEGDRIVMEYTVAESSHAFTQYGVIATSTPGALYPFSSGASGYMKYLNGDKEDEPFFVEGATYKIVFTYTSAAEGVFDIDGTVTKDGVTTRLPQFTSVAQNGEDFNGYIGLWHSGGGVGGVRLTNAKIYGENGLDLGFRANDVNNTNGNFVATDNLNEEYDEVDLADIQVNYEVSLQGVDALYLSSASAIDTSAGKKVYIDWSVASSSGGNACGFLSSGSPEAQYPYTGGQGTLLQSTFALLMQAGCSYHAQIEYLESGYTVMVLKTDATGKTTSISRKFGELYATPETDVFPKGDHIGLYFWAGPAATAELTLKIYDENGNNLGLQYNESGALGTTVITEPEYTVTYMNGTTDISDKFAEAYTKYTCGKGLSRLPVYSDSETKTYVSGWYLDEACTQKFSEIQPFTRQENLTLYAKFEKYTYTVEFDSNSGSGSMASISLAYDESKALTANTFTRTGYDFVGWSQDYDATEAEFADGATVSILTETNGDYITLYAVWSLSHYTITYELNGGTNGANAESYTINDVITLADATKEGVEFLGWYTSSDFAEGTKVTEVRGSSNVTLYAKFSEPEKKSGGCGSNLGAIGGLGGAAMLLAAACLVLKKRSYNK